MVRRHTGSKTSALIAAIVVALPLLLLGRTLLPPPTAPQQILFEFTLPEGDLQLVGVGTYREWKLVSQGFLGLAHARTGTGPEWLNANSSDPVAAVLVPLDNKSQSFVWLGEVKVPNSLELVVTGAKTKTSLRPSTPCFAIPFERSPGTQYTTLQALDATSRLVWSTKSLAGH